MSASATYDVFYRQLTDLTSGDSTSPAERATLVAKYDLGRDEEAEIPTWEDPDISLYKCTDRYGFMHTKPLDTEIPPKVVQIERERAEKWGKMLHDWEKYEKSDKMYRRIYKGIPDSVRGGVWCRFLHIDTIKQPEVYDQMKRVAREASPSLKQIDKDVLRTFRNHIMYWDRYGIKQQQLFHVLAAYSVYNPALGYCQGMSSLVAVLLMYLNEEDAFWGIVTLTSHHKYAMHGFFIPGFPKLKVWFEHHDRAFQHVVPKLSKHFRKRDIEPSHYCTAWFFKLFIDTVPFPVALRVWDAMLLEGQKVVVAAAVSLLRMNRKALLGLGEDDCRIYIQQMGQGNMDEDVFINELHITMNDLSKAGLAVPKCDADTELQDIADLNKQALENARRFLTDQRHTAGIHQNGRQQRSAMDTQLVQNGMVVNSSGFDQSSLSRSQQQQLHQQQQQQQAQGVGLTEPGTLV